MKGRQYSGLWPKEICDYIEEHAASMRQSEMLVRIHEIFQQTYTKEQLMSYYKNHHIKSSFDGKFYKGMASTNKGKKMSPEQYKKCEERMFKPGHIPKNKMAIGVEVINSEGYHITKVADPDVWKFTHRLIYEKAYGMIPSEMMVIFKDGNKDNLDLDNLVVISKSENYFLNKRKMRFTDPKATEAAISLARIDKRIKEKRCGIQKCSRKK